MTAPRRLVDDPDELSTDEMRALAAARGIRPRADFVDGVYSALLAQIPSFGPSDPGSGGHQGSIDPGAGAGAVGATGGAAGAVKASVLGAAGVAGTLKATAIGATLGALVLTGRAVVTQAPDRPLVTTASQAAPPTPSTRATHGSTQVASTPASDERGLTPNAFEVAPAPTNEPAKPGEVAGPSNEPRAPAPRAANPGTLAPLDEGPIAVSPRAGATLDPFEEARLVASAREALRKGDWASGMNLLDQAGRKFPRGVLLEEREALAIEGFVQSGQRARAIERAEAFFRAHPESPHMARVRAVIAAP